MENKEKIILHLCPSKVASDSKEYIDNGYDVRLVGLDFELDVRLYQPPENVYGIIANPPCTQFSLARTTAKTPRDIKGGLELVGACLRIIFMSKPKFWVLENPRGLLRNYLGAPRITIQPYWFGDRYTKQTDLWGDFIIPRFCPIRLTEEELYMTKQHSRKLPQIKGLTQSDRRAICPPNFAKAFFLANP